MTQPFSTSEANLRAMHGIDTPENQVKIQTMDAPPKPVSPVTQEQQFCRRCMRVVQTKDVMIGLTFSPGGNMRSTRRVCVECNGGVIPYTIEQLAALLVEQNRLITETLAINEENRRLTRQVRELSYANFIDPIGGKVYKPNAVEFREHAQGHFLLGTDTRVFEATEAGMKQLAEFVAARPPSGEGNPQEVKRLQRRVAELLKQLEDGGITPCPPSAAATVRKISI